MFNLNKIFSKLRNKNSQDGYTLVETIVALTVATASLISAYGVTIAVENHLRGTAILGRKHAETRVTMERMFRDISETSNKEIVIGYQDDIPFISFPSARVMKGQPYDPDDPEAPGGFHLRPFSYVLASHRPRWIKAVVYYIHPPYEPPYGKDFGNTDVPKLYRKEVPKTDWTSGGYIPNSFQNLGGEVVAKYLRNMYFDYYPAETLAKARVLKVFLDFFVTRDEVKAGALPGELYEMTFDMNGKTLVYQEGTLSLNTRIPLMNRPK
jgi:hypothetical protein